MNTPEETPVKKLTNAQAKEQATRVLLNWVEQQEKQDRQREAKAFPDTRQKVAA